MPLYNVSYWTKLLYNSLHWAYASHTETLYVQLPAAVIAIVLTVKLIAPSNVPLAEIVMIILSTVSLTEYEVCSNSTVTFCDKSAYKCLVTK